MNDANVASRDGQAIREKCVTRSGSIRPGQAAAGEAPRLVYILDYEPRGTRTVDDFLLALARRMTADGWQLTFAFARDPGPVFARELITTGAQYFAVPFPFTWRSARGLIRELQGIRVDVIQTSYVSPFTWPLLALKLFGRTRRLIVLDHASGAAAERRGLRRGLAWLRGRLIGRLVDAFVPVSAANARRGIDRVFLPQHKMRVIPNGVRLDRFRPSDRQTADAITILFAGQLIPEKGVLTLLHAAERVRDRGARNVEWLIAGVGPQAAELQTFCTARGLKRVRFLGHVDDMASLLARADIVVVPSVWPEAFGLVTVEAMATGAAVVVSNAGALPEVVHGAGVVFPAGNDAALADRLIALIRSPELRRRLGRAARRRAEERYSLDRRVARLTALCAEVIAPAADRAGAWGWRSMRRGVRP